MGAPAPVITERIATTSAALWELSVVAMAAAVVAAVAIVVVVLTRLAGAARHTHARPV